MHGDHDGPDDDGHHVEGTRDGEGSGYPTFEEPTTPVTRTVFAVFGLATFLAPWELLIRPGHPFELGKLPFWLISLGALAIGAPMVIAAILGPSRRLVVDTDRRLFVETTRAAFGLNLSRSRRFADLVELAVVEDDWTDGPATWRVEARFRASRRPWTIRTFAGRAAAERQRDDLAARIVRAGA